MCRGYNSDMSRAFPAIYENGVFRPLQPVALREHEVVTLSIAGDGEASVAVQPASPNGLLLQFVARMESLPDADGATTSPVDGLCNRDHDRLIYGE